MKAIVCLVLMMMVVVPTPTPRPTRTMRPTNTPVISVTPYPEPVDGTPYPVGEFSPPSAAGVVEFKAGDDMGLMALAIVSGLVISVAVIVIVGKKNGKV